MRHLERERKFPTALRSLFIEFPVARADILFRDEPRGRPSPFCWRTAAANAMYFSPSDGGINRRLMLFYLFIYLISSSVHIYSILIKISNFPVK